MLFPPRSLGRVENNLGGLIVLDNNLETQKKSISMKNSQFFDYLLYAKSK
jgi:hypothetical protein